MNVSVIFNKLLSMAKSVGGNSFIIAKKHAPEILITSGIGGFILSIVATTKATNKTNDILENKERRLANCGMSLELSRSNNFDEMMYTAEDYNNDVSAISRQTKFAIVKAWVPVATLAATSTTLILCGFKIINGRYAATMAAYKILESKFDHYRENAIERYGKDADWHLMNDVKGETLELALAERDANRKIDEENKNRKLIKKRKKTAYSNIYNAIFDQYSDRWQRYWNPQEVLYYLGVKQNELNDMLRIKKHVFVNDVYDKLGLPRTSEGAVTGWIITREHPDSKVDLGIDNMPEDEIRRILATRRNEEIQVHLNIVPDGLIYNLIDSNDRTEYIGEGRERNFPIYN